MKENVGFSHINENNGFIVNCFEWMYIWHEAGRVFHFFRVLFHFHKVRTLILRISLMIYLQWLISYYYTNKYFVFH